MELRNGVVYGELLKPVVERIGIDIFCEFKSSFHEIRLDKKLRRFTLWAYEMC
jgi:hypothetical protein